MPWSATPGTSTGQCCTAASTRRARRRRLWRSALGAPTSSSGPSPASPSVKSMPSATRSLRCARLSASRPSGKTECLCAGGGKGIRRDCRGRSGHDLEGRSWIMKGGWGGGTWHHELTHWGGGGGGGNYQLFSFGCFVYYIINPLWEIQVVTLPSASLSVHRGWTNTVRKYAVKLKVDWDSGRKSLATPGNWTRISMSIASGFSVWHLPALAWVLRLAFQSDTWPTAISGVGWGSFSKPFVSCSLIFYSLKWQPIYQKLI